MNEEEKISIDSFIRLHLRGRKTDWDVLRWNSTKILELSGTGKEFQPANEQLKRGETNKGNDWLDEGLLKNTVVGELVRGERKGDLKEKQELCMWRIL